MFRVTKRGVSEQRADSCEPSVPGAHAIVALLLEMVEEGADERGIEVVNVQLRCSSSKCPECDDFCGEARSLMRLTG